MPVFTTALMAFFLLSGATSTPRVNPSLTFAVPQKPVQVSYTVAMTGYNAVPEQTDSDPSITASGAYSNPDIIAARSSDLADELPFGTVIELVPDTATSSPTCGLPLVEELVGLRVIADSMHSRMRNKIDILFHANDLVRVGGKRVNPARALGACKNVQVRIVGRIDMSKVPRTQTELRLMLDKKALAVSR